MQDEQPRQHHYEFAHVVLRAIAMRAGPQLIEAAADGSLTPLVKDSWHRVGDGLPDERRLSPDGLFAARRDTDEMTAAVVTLPNPTRVAEAYMVAIVAARSSTETGYFLLEKPAADKAGPASVLTQWTRDGRHLRLADGPLPEPAAFLEAIARVAAIGS